MTCSKGWLVGGAVALFCLVWLGWSGCDKRPTKPEPPPPQPKDYPVYFMNELNGTLFTYYPLSRRIDTAALDYGLERKVTVSADGKLLYLAGPDNVIVLDADSRDLLLTLPYPAGVGVAASPDNCFLTLMYADTYVLRTSGYSVVLQDTVTFKEAIFSSDSKYLFAVGSRSTPSGNLYVAELTDSAPVLAHAAFTGSIMHVRLTPAQDKLIFYARYHFGVYDVAADSTIMDIQLWPGKGNLGMTLDGKYAFFSNPSTPFLEQGTTDLYVFDIEANQIADTIVIDDFLDSIGARATYGVGRMAFTPDGRWMVAHNAQEPFELYLFDLQKMALVDFHRFSNNWFSNITVQQSK